MDDGEKRDRLGRRRVPVDRREALLSEYERSGLTQAAFARKAGINYQTFASWRRLQRLQRRSATGAARTRPVAAIKFAEVALPTARVTGAELSVHLPDGTVVRGTDPVQLGRTVRALRQTEGGAC